MMLTKLLLSLLLSAETPTPLQAARSQFDAGNYGESVKTLTAAVAQSPRDAALQHWLGRSYYELRDYDKAIDSMETAVKLAPDNAEYHRWLGRAYGGKAEQSRSFFTARKVKGEFEKAVRLAPQSIPARRDLMQ